MISAKVLAQFLKQRQKTDDIGLVRFVRAWMGEWKRKEEG
jgi:hypothetical protein